MGLSLWVGTCEDDYYLVHSKNNIILGWSNMRIREVDFGLPSTWNFIFAWAIVIIHQSNIRRHDRHNFTSNSGATFKFHVQSLFYPTYSQVLPNACFNILNSIEIGTLFYKRSLRLSRELCTMTRKCDVMIFVLQLVSLPFPIFPNFPCIQYMCFY